MENSNQQMGAAVLTEYGKIEWRHLKIPQIGDSEVLIKTKYASICGSDQHIFKGEFHPRTQLPLIPGHEFAGVVADFGQNVEGLKKGDLVVVDPILWCGKCPACELRHYPACTSLKLVGVDMDGGFGEYVGVKDFMVHKIPEHIPAKHAALVEVLSIGFHACNRANVGKNDTIAIWGAGKIGQCILQAANIKTDNSIFIVDIIEERLNIARQIYKNIITINAKKTDPVSEIKNHTNGRGVDVAFEAIGHAEQIRYRPEPVAACVQAIRGAGTICVLGLSDHPVSFIMKELIWKEASIVASRVTQGEFSEAIEHLSLNHLYPDALISCEMMASDAQRAFEQLDMAPQKYLKILLKFDDI